MRTIAVFIPVYNGMPYLEKTVKSVLNQTYRNFVLYCVNDGSTDDSLEVLNKLAIEDKRIIVFTKKQGGSTAKSWNYILPKIHEDFIFYMSQDDLLSPETFEKMIQKQQEIDADCVLPDMAWYHEDRLENEKMIGVCGNRSVVLNGDEAVKKSLFWQIHGFALRKRSLYENEHFFEDAFDTDEYMTRKLFYKSRKVAFSEGTFYYRQDNPAAITKSFCKKNYHSLMTYERMYALLSKDSAFISEKKQWFSFMVSRYLHLVDKYNLKEGLVTDLEIDSVRKILLSVRRNLLLHLFSLRKFRDLRILKKKYHPKKFL